MMIAEFVANSGVKKFKNSKILYIISYKSWEITLTYASNPKYWKKQRVSSTLILYWIILDSGPSP